MFFWCFPLPSPSFVAGNTYNADFDGDEINLHFPQSQLVGCPCVLVARVARVVARVVCSCCCSCCCVHTCVSCDDKFFGITVLGALTPMRNNHMVGTRTEDNKSIQHFNSNTDTRALLLLVLHGDGLDVSTTTLLPLFTVDKNVRVIILMLELFIMLLMLCCFLWSTIRYFFNSAAN